MVAKGFYGVLSHSAIMVVDFPAGIPVAAGQPGGQPAPLLDGDSWRYRAPLRMSQIGPGAGRRQHG